MGLLQLARGLRFALGAAALLSLAAAQQACDRFPMSVEVDVINTEEDTLLSSHSGCRRETPCFIPIRREVDTAHTLSFRISFDHPLYYYDGYSSEPTLVDKEQAEQVFTEHIKLFRSFPERNSTTTKPFTARTISVLGGSGATGLKVRADFDVHTGCYACDPSASQVYKLQFDGHLFGDRSGLRFEPTVPVILSEATDDADHVDYNAAQCGCLPGTPGNLSYCLTNERVPLIARPYTSSLHDIIPDGMVLRPNAATAKGNYITAVFRPPTSGKYHTEIEKVTVVDSNGDVYLMVSTNITVRNIVINESVAIQLVRTAGNFYPYTARLSASPLESATTRMECAACDVANAPFPYIEDVSITHQIEYGNISHTRLMPLNKVLRANGNSSVEIVVAGKAPAYGEISENLTTVAYEGVAVTLERTPIKILDDVEDINVLRDPATGYWFPLPNSIGSGGQGGCEPWGPPQLTCEQDALGCFTRFERAIVQHAIAPFGHEELIGYVDMPPVPRVRLSEDSKILSMHFREPESKLSVRIPRANVEFAEPYMFVDAQTWAQTGYVHDCSGWTFTPNTTAWAEDHGSFSFAVANAGEALGDFGVSLNCPTLSAPKAGPYNRLNPDESERVTTDVYGSGDEVQQTHTCEATLHIRHQRFWDTLGKAVKCPVNVTTWSGLFVPPCLLARPPATVNATISSSQFTWTSDGKPLQYKNVLVANNGSESTMLNISVYPPELCMVGNSHFYSAPLHPNERKEVQVFIVGSNQRSCIITVEASKRLRCDETSVFHQEEFQANPDSGAGGAKGANTGVVVGSAVGGVIAVLSIVIGLLVLRVRKMKSIDDPDADSLDLDQFVHEKSLRADQFLLEGAYGPYRKLVRFQAQKDGALCAMQAQTPGIVLNGTILGERGDTEQITVDEINEIYFDPMNEDIWIQTPCCVYLLDKPLTRYAPFFSALKLGLGKLSTEKA